jgi:hypothetical protein
MRSVELLESRRLLSGTGLGELAGPPEGFQLPAVQKVREAAIRSGHELPAVQMVREAAERLVDDTPA